MGRYRSQYVYRCPHVTCRNRILEPSFLPAYTAIDWTVRGQRIGDMPLKEFFADRRTKTTSLGHHPLAPKTLARIEAGIRRFARPITLEAAGNTFERRPGVRTWPVDGPLTTQTASETKALAVPPLLIPVEGRDGKSAVPVQRPLRTQSTRSETGLVTLPPMLVPAGGTWNDDASSVTEPMRTRTVRESEAVVVAPFIAELRGGSSDARTTTEALATVTASGNHHGLVVPPLVMRNNDGGAEMSTSVAEPMRTLTTHGHQSLVTVGGLDWAALYAYDQGAFRSLRAALPTQTTVEGDAVMTGADIPAVLPPVEDCTFRMLEPDEIGRGMAFLPTYIVLGNRRERVRQYGNAVTPPAAEVIVSALVEAITGEEVATP
jgi:DNA (cytosine-5)-methyltransferase 1